MGKVCRGKKQLQDLSLSLADPTPASVFQEADTPYFPCRIPDVHSGVAKYAERPQRSHQEIKGGDKDGKVMVQVQVVMMQCRT